MTANKTDSAKVTLPAIGVCSFPRAGSSLTMRMLHAGGIEPVEGTMSGSYELGTLNDIAGVRALDVAGHSIKLLDSFMHLPTLETADSWKLIWLQRNEAQQAKSHVKFMNTIAPGMLGGPGGWSRAQKRIAQSLRDDNAQALAKLRHHGPVLIVRFESILADPLAAAGWMAAFLEPEFELNALAAHVVVLDRGPECQPDLSIELGLCADAESTPGIVSFRGSVHQSQREVI